MIESMCINNAHGGEDERREVAGCGLEEAVSMCDIYFGRQFS